MLEFGIFVEFIEVELSIGQDLEKMAEVYSTGKVFQLDDGYLYVLRNTLVTYWIQLRSAVLEKGCSFCIKVNIDYFKLVKTSIMKGDIMP